jgi:5'-nucleotidase (lipoprotein e(P4) family)
MPMRSTPRAHSAGLPRLFVLVALLVPAGGAHAQAPADPAHKQVKYVRDSEEYAALTRQVYRQALAALTTQVRERTARTSGPWAVALDVDETVLDNSTYELDRATYGLTFEKNSWNAWVDRAEAGVVPGTLEFISGVRRLGGHVVYISNRDEVTRPATITNLRRFSLWTDQDRLCLATDSAYTKRVRRSEVIEGKAPCGWPGMATPVLVWVGDQLGDFPAAGEADADAGSDEAFGRRYFLLPNPMYGAWTTRVTRKR